MPCEAIEKPHLSTGGGGGVKCPSKYKRYIVAINNGTELSTLIGGTNIVSDGQTLTAPSGFGGHLYNPSSTTYTIAFMSWMAYAGKNVWAKSRVRTWSLTGSLVLNNASIQVQTNSHVIGTPSIDPLDIDGTTLSPRSEDQTAFDDDYWTPYNVRVQRGRWCYWIVDFVWVKYPDKTTFFV